MFEIVQSYLRCNSYSATTVSLQNFCCFLTVIGLMNPSTDCSSLDLKLSFTTPCCKLPYTKWYRTLLTYLVRRFYDPLFAVLIADWLSQRLKTTLPHSFLDPCIPLRRTRGLRYSFLTLHNLLPFMVHPHFLPNRF